MDEKHTQLIELTIRDICELPYNPPEDNLVQMTIEELEYFLKRIVVEITASAD